MLVIETATLLPSVSVVSLHSTSLALLLLAVTTHTAQILLSPKFTRSTDLATGPARFTLFAIAGLIVLAAFASSSSLFTTQRSKFAARKIVNEIKVSFLFCCVRGDPREQDADR